MLRKRITELQLYRRQGLTTAADIEKYEVDLAKRVWIFYFDHRCQSTSICDIGASQAGSCPGLPLIGETPGSISRTALFRP